MDERKRVRAYDDFRWNRNVIAVENEEEFEAFRDFICEYDEENLDLDRLFRSKIPTYDDMCAIMARNYEDHSLIMFEVHLDEPCSITWSGADNYDSNVDWYGVEPYRMADLM